MKNLGIIIPAFNCANSLSRILDQICKSTLDEFEVIVVDDGSADDTLAVARRYEDREVKVIHQENKGVGAARNAGIKVCDSQYIWFVDADDDIMPDAIETILTWTEGHPCDCYYFGFEKISRGNNTRSTITNAKDLTLTSSAEIASHFNELFAVNLLNPLWNKVFNKTIIDEHSIGFTNMKAGEDAVFILDFLTFARSMLVSTRVLYRYVLGSDTSTMRRYNPSFLKEQQAMFYALQDYCKKTGASAPAIEHMWSRHALLGCCYNVYKSIEGRPKLREYWKNVHKELQTVNNILSIFSDKPVELDLIASVKQNLLIFAAYIKARKGW